MAKHSLTNGSPLPWEQHEYPGKRPLDDVRLHARREGVFTILFGVLALATALVPVLGLTPALELALAAPGLDLLVAVPLGALAFPATFSCADLACELFGRRRAFFAVMAAALLAAAGFAVLALGKPLAPPTLWTGAALWAFAATALLVNLLLYSLGHRLSGGRHLWLRHALAAVAGQVAGGAVFFAATGSQAALLSALPYAAAAIVLGVPLLYLAAGWLGVFLRLPLAHQEARLPRARVHAAPKAEPV